MHRNQHVADRLKIEIGIKSKSEWDQDLFTLCIVQIGMGSNRNVIGMYIVQCTLYIVHCTLYIVHCTLYIVHCTMYIVHCTLYNVHNTEILVPWYPCPLVRYISL